MREQLIPRGKDDTLGSDKKLPTEDNEGKEAIKSSQPKAEDANTVERLGLMKVPRRFSFAEAKEARETRMPIIARSEHPDEAVGLSGVNPSLTFRSDEQLPGEIEAEFKLLMLHDRDLMFRTKEFCKLNGLSETDYLKQLTWSFWEKIPGTNLSLVQDNAVPERYWLLASWQYAKESADETISFGDRDNLFQIIDGKINSASNSHSPVPVELSDKIPDMIKNYEKIQNHFGPKTSWIVEMQISAGDRELYFLQRHPSRDKEGTDWRFEEPADSDEMVLKSDAVTIVRGITAKDGLEDDMIFDAYGRPENLPQQKICSDLLVKGFPIAYQNWIAKSDMFLSIYPSAAGQANDPHSAMIPLTKSKLYISVPKFEKKLPKIWIDKLEIVEEAKKAQREQYENGLGNRSPAKYAKMREYNRDIRNLLKIKMRVRSDGTEARIKILDIH